MPATAARSADGAARTARRIWRLLEPLHAVAYFTPGGPDRVPARRRTRLLARLLRRAVRATRTGPAPPRARLLLQLRPGAGRPCPAGRLGADHPRAGRRRPGRRRGRGARTASRPGETVWTRPASPRPTGSRAALAGLDHSGRILGAVNACPAPMPDEP